ncbi:uncharacterized protein EDB93DRAFT_891397 [Suillus bovinus]|uniref:uncharacterized protein n=1 Tax=Suillus bovinus TaxID=48563 RepID=UPI001B8690F8|nr:uncharacterized protein EDB93DRAFT_891397 [Suillus bovinus]KAG2132912.1 hypothetical protein EDB93DRAFT_891397 [Suillus bovinus]
MLHSMYAWVVLLNITGLFSLAPLPYCYVTNANFLNLFILPHIGMQEYFLSRCKTYFRGSCPSKLYSLDRLASMSVNGHVFHFHSYESCRTFSARMNRQFIQC